MKMISNLVPFPTDAESNPFFAALASVMLKALDYSNDTLYYCAPKGKHCVECGQCGDRATLHKHHLQLYHIYQTVTGVGLGWYWPEDPEEKYQVISGGGPSWDWPDEFIGFIMDVAGLQWKRYHKHDLPALFPRITGSIDEGFPVLMKLGNGPDWHVVCGYDGNNTLYGLDSHLYYHEEKKPLIEPDGYTDDGLFIMSDWHDLFDNVIIITGRCAPLVTLRQILTCMAETLEHPAHRLLETEINHRIDCITPDNALETARWLNDRASFPIEARWHVADCTDSTLPDMTDVEEVRKNLLSVTAQYVFDNDLDATHGTCWKIWALLGVGPDTGYTIGPLAAEQVSRSETQQELKRLFSIVFENDRIVLDLLHKSINAC